MHVKTHYPNEDEQRAVTTLPFIKEWVARGWINPAVPLFKGRASRASLSRDAYLADRVIRCTGISLCRLLKDEAFEDDDLWEKYPDYIDAMNLRLWLYQNQNYDGLTEKLHKLTLLVTFDGSKGAGKSELSEALGRFVTYLDPSEKVKVFKPSWFSDGLSGILGIYDGKEKKREQFPISDLELDGHLLLYAAALAKLVVKEKPKSTEFSTQSLTDDIQLFDDAFLDRSFITTLAKSYDVAAKNDNFILSEIYHEHVQKYTIDKMEFDSADEKKKKALQRLGLEPKLIPRHEFEQQYYNDAKRPENIFLKPDLLRYPEAITKRDFYRLQFLIEKMRNKYVLPDLAVILLCDSQQSLHNQETRGTREVESISETEVARFNTFRTQNFIPNALYLDQSRTLAENFRIIAMNVKECYEDKKKYSLAERITPQSIDDFIQRGGVKKKVPSH